jgi:hypothetical protein
MAAFLAVKNMYALFLAKNGFGYPLVFFYKLISG